MMDDAAIKSRLREAAGVLLRMPPASGPKAFGSNWPDIVRNTVGALWWYDPVLQKWVREVPVIRPSPPMGAEIDRMDEVLEWLCWIVDEAEIVRMVERQMHRRDWAVECVRRRQRVVWFRACGVTWRRLESKIGKSRETLRKTHGEGIAVIVRKLRKEGSSLPLASGESA